METKMVVNKRNIKETFDFLVNYSWFLSNSSDYRWLSSWECGYVNVRYFRVEDFLTTDTPLSSNGEYKRIINITNDPKKKLERQPHAIKYCKCEKSNLAIKFEIAKFLEDRINWAKQDLDSEKNPNKNVRKTEILGEYTRLFQEYQKEMREDYNSRSEEEKRELVRANPDTIYAFDNPSFSIQKEALMSYKKIRGQSSEEDYFHEQYVNALDTVRKVVSNESDEEVLIYVMRKNPICAAEVLRNPVSRRVATEALKVFPELLFYSNWTSNKEHLLLNSTVYSILESDLGQENFNESICQTVIEANMGLMFDNTKNYGTEEDRARTIRLAGIMYRGKHPDLRNQYAESAITAKKPLVKETQ